MGGQARPIDAAPLPTPRRRHATELTPRSALASTRALRSIRHLERFLGVDEIIGREVLRANAPLPDVALVWGRKESGDATERWAREHEVPVWYLEDGWVRGCSSDAHSRLTYSLLVDDAGVYYDAASPSAIENFLTDEVHVATECDAATLDRARRWRERMVAAGVTKYNGYRSTGLEPVPSDPFVLVVDQTRDDASVRHGAMEAADFERMLEAAIDENPGCRVLVRTHPDVVAGRRRGYLGDAAARYGLELAAGRDNPYRWLVGAERIYAGTSQLGYEGLLAERPVTLFGAPFYAGWGLTDDRSTSPALARRATAADIDLDTLFHASHVRLARYRSPVDGAEWTLGDCIDHVELQRANFARNAKRVHAVGITPWKRRYVARFLASPDGQLTFGTANDVPDVDALLTWSFRHGATARPAVAESERAEALRDAADGAAPTDEPDARAPLPVWRMEDGFLRSAGLGSDYTAPGSLVIDESGLYFDPGSPSDLETLLNGQDLGPGEIRRAARLRREILARGVSKYNTSALEKPSRAERPEGRNVILVVGQVEDDDSIKRGTAEVSTNARLLQAVRKARPDDWIVYRPHPDVQSGNRRGQIDELVLQACADATDDAASVGEAIESCDELHTMTSLTGFEALMRGKRVVTWGAPFYAGWGLTEDRMAVERRTRRRTLDELVYLALIAYPRYLDIDSGEFVSAETMVRIIDRQREAGAGRGGTWGQRQIRKLGNIVRGLRYAP